MAIVYTRTRGKQRPLDSLEERTEELDRQGILDAERNIEVYENELMSS